MLLDVLPVFFLRMSNIMNSKKILFLIYRSLIIVSERTVHSILNQNFDLLNIATKQKDLEISEL